MSKFKEKDISQYTKNIENFFKIVEKIDLNNLKNLEKIEEQLRKSHKKLEKDLKNLDIKK